MGKRIEIKPGDIYGRWAIIQEIERRRSPSNGRSYRMVKCECECGTIREVPLESLRQRYNPSRSCGCLQKEAARKTANLNREHGMSGTPTYYSWSMMKQRCYNPSETGYPNYGGRGITVCERWKNSFEAFLKDMGERPSLDHSIDRLDVNGDYEPGNCRWATEKQQQRNRRNNVNLTFRGETLCISEWAEKIGIPRKTLEKRLNHHGFTVEEALTLPLRARRVS